MIKIVGTNGAKKVYFLITLIGNTSFGIFLSFIICAKANDVKDCAYFVAKKLFSLLGTLFSMISKEYVYTILFSDFKGCCVKM